MAKEKKQEKNYTVQGKLLPGQEKEKTFSKEILAYNPENAAEHAMALFGSKNRIKRRDIQITEIKETK